MEALSDFIQDPLIVVSFLAGILIAYALITLPDEPGLLTLILVGLSLLTAVGTNYVALKIFSGQKQGEQIVILFRTFWFGFLGWVGLQLIYQILGAVWVFIVAKKKNN